MTRLSTLAVMSRGHMNTSASCLASLRLTRNHMGKQKEAMEAVQTIMMSLAGRS